MTEKRPDGWPTSPNEVQKVVKAMRPPLTPEQEKDPELRAYYELGYFIVPRVIDSPQEEPKGVAGLARLPEDTKLETEIVEQIKEAPIEEKEKMSYLEPCTTQVLLRKEAVAVARTMPPEIFNPTFRQWTLENTAGKDYARAVRLNRTDPRDPTHRVPVMRIPRSCIDLNWRYMHKYLQRGRILAHLSWYERYCYEDALIELLERSVRFVASQEKGEEE